MRAAPTWSVANDGPKHVLLNSHSPESRLAITRHEQEIFHVRSDDDDDDDDNDDDDNDAFT
jgi:hypothetical protein